MVVPMHLPPSAVVAVDLDLGLDLDLDLVMLPVISHSAHHIRPSRLVKLATRKEIWYVFGTDHHVKAVT